jgi:hypothetical protein
MTAEQKKEIFRTAFLIINLAAESDEEISKSRLARLVIKADVDSKKFLGTKQTD